MVADIRNAQIRNHNKHTALHHLLKWQLRGAFIVGIPGMISMMVCLVTLFAGIWTPEQPLHGELTDTAAALFMIGCVLIAGCVILFLVSRETSAKICRLGHLCNEDCNPPRTISNDPDWR